MVCVDFTGKQNFKSDTWGNNSWKACLNVETMLKNADLCSWLDSEVDPPEQLESLHSTTSSSSQILSLRPTWGIRFWAPIIRSEPDKITTIRNGHSKKAINAPQTVTEPAPATTTTTWNLTSILSRAISTVCLHPSRATSSSSNLQYYSF